MTSIKIGARGRCWCGNGKRWGAFCRDCTKMAAGGGLAGLVGEWLIRWLL